MRDAIHSTRPGAIFCAAIIAGTRCTHLNFRSAAGCQFLTADRRHNSGATFATWYFMVFNCFSPSKPSSTMVGSLLRPAGFCRLACPSLTPLPSHGCQVLSAISRDSDAGVALTGGLLLDLRVQEFLPRNSRLHPRFIHPARTLSGRPPAWAFTPLTLENEQR